MLSQAIDAMLQRLEEFLPASGTPPPSVFLVSVQEQAVGLGKRRGLGLRNGFPVILAGLRVASTVRFQLWDTGPTAVEASLSDLAEQLLAQKEVLYQEGFLEIELKTVSLSEQVTAVNAWRQTAEFELLYEFQSENSDGAGGLISQIPAELHQALGTLRITGDLTVWNSVEVPRLRLNGMRSVEGLAMLSFLPGVMPPGTVTVRRTFQGAVGSPASFATLDTFLDAVGGPAPAERHAIVQFSGIADFAAALGPGSVALQLVDELGAPRDFEPRSRGFDPPLELASRGDRFEVMFDGAALDVNQILYLRGIRGAA